MRNNAKFIKTEEIIRIAKIPLLSIMAITETIEKHYTWAEALAFVDAGVIVFGSKECMHGWLACQS